MLIRVVGKLVFFLSIIHSFLKPKTYTHVKDKKQQNCTVPRAFPLYKYPRNDKNNIPLAS